MSESFQTWQNVLLQWVNCLGLQEKRVQSVKDLGDGRFFANLLKTLLDMPTSDMTTDQANEDITSFLKSSYPNYGMAAESCEVEDEIEIMYITSLLLFHSVVQCKCEKIVTCMYTLNQDVQCYITHFLQCVLEEGNITRNILKNSIYSYKSSPRTPDQRNQFTVISPNFGTPKGRTLKEIYESPLAQKTKELSEKRLELRRLNEDLEAEQKEKYELQEQLRKQQEKTKHLVKQLNEKNEEIKKLRQDWLDDESLSQGMFLKERAQQEKKLNKEMKDLEKYTSSIEEELGTFRENNDSLQRQLAKAEQECALWQSKFEEYQSICFKLQSDVEEKELELCRVNEVCSELQNHMQKLRTSSERSIEEDMSSSYIPSSPECIPENVAEAVIDVQLREMEEDNIKLKDQIKDLLKDEDEMAKRICDLECRLEVTNENANYLKASKLELEKKVEVMTALQHELEESEKRLSNATMEIDHLSKERNLLEQHLAGLQELLQCRDSELKESKNVAETLSIDFTGLQEKFEQTQNILAVETDRVAKLETEARETQLQLNSRSQEVVAIKSNHKIVCENLESIDKHLSQNMRHVKEILFSDVDQNMEENAIDADYMSENEEIEMPESEDEALSAVCLSVKAKVHKMNNLLTELDAKNLESINTRTNLESTCRELNENIKNLHAEIAELEAKEQSQLIEKSQLEDCLKKADENIEVLQLKVTEYTDKIEKLTAILEEKKTVVVELERFKESLSVTNIKLEEENSSINERLSSVTNELTEMKDSKDKIEDLYSKLLIRSEELSNTVNNLNSSIEILELQLKELLQEREISANKIERMMSELKEVHARKDNLEKIYTAAVKENEESIANLNNESELLRRRITELENKVSISDNELQHLNNNLAEINKEKEMLREQYNTDNEEKLEHIKLLNEQVALLKINVANLENEKKIMGNDLENIKLKLIETQAEKHYETENYNRTIFEKDEFINNLKADIQKQIGEICKEKESAINTLEVTKAKLLKVAANKDELKTLFEKQSETYKEELASLTDKLNNLTEKLTKIQHEKAAVDAELCLKDDELLKTHECNESLRNETKQLEVVTEKQKEQLKTSMVKIEELIAKEKLIAEELDTTKSELLKEKQYKESLFEELTEKQKCLQSITEESNNLQNKVVVITEERDVLQNTVCKLTSELENVESNKAEILNLYDTLKLEADKTAAIKLELEEKIINLEKEKSFMNASLNTAKSDLMSQQEQQKEVLHAHNQEIEERKEEISQLSQKVHVLETEINALECDKKKLIAHLEAAKTEVLELKSSNEELLNSSSKLKTENEALENLKIFLEDKIQQLQQDRDFIKQELEYVTISLQSVEESKALLTVQYHEEFQMKEEKIIKLLKEAADLQTSLDQVIEERDTIDKNLILTKLELKEIRISKEELLKTHTQQIQETEENVKNVHQNALKVKTILLKKVEEVEGERDMEKKLREEVQQMLDQEKDNLESVKSQMEMLVSEKDMVSKLCADLKNNVCSLREIIVPIQEIKSESTEVVDFQQDVKICPSEYPLVADTEPESLHVLYDCKKKLPSKPWNLDHYDFVNICANKLSRNISEHESDWSASTSSSNLEKQAIPLEAKAADIKLTMVEAPTSTEEITSSKFCEVVMKLESLNTELEAARGEIMGVLKSNDILRTELSRTDRRCTDITQKYNQLTVTNGILKAENEKLLKSIEGLNNLKSLLEESEKDLANEKTLKAKLKSEKDVLESSYEKVKSDLDILNETNATLSVTLEAMKDKMAVLKEQNEELNNKVKEYEMCQLKIEEESSKLAKIHQERESEYKKMSESLQTLRDMISGFQKSLKNINNKYESLVSDVSVSYDNLKEIEHQKIKLEQLLILLHLEYDDISQCVVKCTYDNWKVNELITEGNDSLASEKCNDTKCQQLDELQFQISALISGIEIATLESSKVDSQCNILLENHNILETEPSPILEKLYTDRADCIKQIVNKLKSETELGMKRKDWDPEDSLEAQSEMTNIQKETVKHSALLLLRIQLDEALKLKAKEVETFQEQNNLLLVELANERTAKSDLEKNLVDVQKLNEELLKEKNDLYSEKSAAEEKKLHLELQLLKNSEIKQAYEFLLEENNKMLLEIDERKARLVQMEAHREEKIKAVRQEYENKLERLKAKMRVLYDEEIEKKMKKSREECEHMQALCREYKEKVKSCQQEIALQKSQIWELGDKLLLSDKEKKKLQEELFNKQDSFLERFDTAKNPDRRTKVSARDVKTLSAVDEQMQYMQRKKTIHKSVPSGMGLMFDPEDEEGEVFNTTNLADLKAGRCIVPPQPDDYKGRISELQYRNSLCPPHLKSSYPAETQFHDPREYREDDLKLGCAVDVENVDTRSTSMLLPSDKQRKRDRGQTSYKKPGPPTPGKNGGRHSLQGNEVLTPRAPLRESNDGACVRKASTPSRLRNLFSNKNRQDENTPVTPRGRRLSNFFRKQVK